jgi:hypothetical protein
MKRKIYALMFASAFVVGSTEVFAQKDNVGIGTSKPDQSAVLDISSTNKGLLMPRLSLQQRDGIQNPAKGLMIYQTDLLSGFYFYDGEKWQPLTDNAAKSVAGVDGDWTLDGNVATGTSVLGTTNGQPLRIVVSGAQAGKIDFDFNLRNTFLGYQSGLLVDITPSTGGIRNVGIGYQSMRGNVTSITGDDNVGLGVSTLTRLTTGAGNLGVGTFALQNVTQGSSNIGIGTNTANNTSTGSFNTAIGAGALRKTNNLAGSNTGIGYNAGFNNVAGSANVFLGYQAGFNETGSNKLYIANTSATTPLIKGEFDNKNLKVNTGATVSQTVGFLAVGNFDAAFAMPSPTNTYRLIVEGGIITEKIKVAVKGSPDWADYVFEPSYKLMPLDKVESFVKENKHLPNVPSADEMAKNGLDVMQTSAKLMEKIEELTLYMIEMNKEIKALKSENEALKNKK